jgi:hypothetical protein
VTPKAISSAAHSQPLHQGGRAAGPDNVRTSAAASSTVRCRVLTCLFLHSAQRHQQQPAVHQATSTTAALRLCTTTSVSGRRNQVSVACCQHTLWPRLSCCICARLRCKGANIVMCCSARVCLSSQHFQTTQQQQQLESFSYRAPRLCLSSARQPIQRCFFSPPPLTLSSSTAALYCSCRWTVHCPRPHGADSYISSSCF